MNHNLFYYKNERIVRKIDIFYNFFKNTRELRYTSRSTATALSRIFPINATTF